MPDTSGGPTLSIFSAFFCSPETKRCGCSSEKALLPEVMSPRGEQRVIADELVQLDVGCVGIDATFVEVVRDSKLSETPSVGSTGSRLTWDSFHRRAARWHHMEKPDEAPLQGSALMLQVPLTRGDEKLGIDLDDRLLGLQVIGITNGACARYNASQTKNPHRRLRANDLIVAVNGSHDRGKMIKCLKEVRSLTLKVARPDVIHVVLLKGDLDWGLDVHRSFRSTSIEVRAIAPDGAVQRYNDSAADHQKVCQADCILSCNGVCGMAERVWLEFKKSERVELKLLRAFPSGHAGAYL